jgi:hypothetical protein
LGRNLKSIPGKFKAESVGESRLNRAAVQLAAPALSLGGREIEGLKELSQALHLRIRLAAREYL